MPTPLHSLLDEARRVVDEAADRVSMLATARAPLERLLAAVDRFR